MKTRKPAPEGTPPGTHAFQSYSLYQSAWITLPGDGWQSRPAQIAKGPGQSRLLCNHALSQAAMQVEQRMTTGGGWQDQAGSIFPGTNGNAIKSESTAP